MAGLVTFQQDEPISSSRLAELTGVPSHYLSKIMRKMVEAEYVRSRKGHGGGFILNIDPEKLTIIDVLAAAGFDIDEQPCVFGWDECKNDNPCPLHPIWKRLKDVFYDWAFNTNFDEIRQESGMMDNLEKWSQNQESG